MHNLVEGDGQTVVGARSGARGLATQAGLALRRAGARPRLLERVHNLVEDDSQGVLGAGSGLKPVAARDIEAGEIVFQESGGYSAAPSVHTIQVDTDRHFDMAGDARFTAHSFAPSCYCRIVEPSEHPIDIVALRPIRRGEEISFDYTTTEWELSNGGFVDAASGRQCLGFKHRTAEEKLALLASGILPRHILALWLAETVGTAP